jgi:hypothetical protein
MINAFLINNPAQRRGCLISTSYVSGGAIEFSYVLFNIILIIKNNRENLQSM